MKYFKNTSWLFAEKILGMVVGLFVGVWVARYLGPDQFGTLSYVLAFVGLFAPLSKLGFDGIVSRDIARNESDIDVLISTTVLFRFIGSLLIVVLTSLYMYLTKEQDIYFYLAVIISMTFVVSSYQIIEFYFRAKVKARYIAVANSTALMISSILKILFILSDFSLVFFALANLVQAIMAMALLVIFFKSHPNYIKLSKVKCAQGFKLLRESWPLIFGGFFALVYLNIDQVMIESMLGSYQVGQYSAAVRISNVWYFIPLTIGWSVQTAIVNAKKQGDKLYYNRLQMLFSVLALMAYVLIIPVSYFSDNIISLLYGKAYSLAGDVLSLHIIASLFVFVGSARGLWVLNESVFNFQLLSSVFGAIINIVLNFVMIPNYGIKGAALSTLISYFFAQVGSGLFYYKTRKVFYLQMRGMFLLDIKLIVRGLHEK